MIISGFPQTLEIMETLEKHEKKVPCMEKSWNLKKQQLNNHRKIMEFCAPVARKLAVRHTKLVCLTASFLATGGYFKIHAGLPACLFQYITVAAFHIYALHGEDVAKMGGWRLCIK